VAVRLRRMSWPLGCRNWRFESRWGHGCLSIVFICCVVLCRQRPLRRADHLSERVLPCVLIRLRNLPCEAAKVLTRTVQTLMMMMIILNMS
jgi:hypothetical protein